MANTPVQCQNCGARYKIPDTFAGASAKCKKCGSMIDVASARTDGDAPAAAPTTGRTKGRATSTGTAARTGTPAGATGKGGTRRRRETATAGTGAPGGKTKGAASGSRRGQRRGAAEADSEEGARPRYERKKDNSPMMMMAVIGAMAVVAAVLFFVFFNKNDTATQAESAKTAQAAADQAAADQAAADKAAAAKAAADAAADPAATGVTDAVAKPEKKKPVKKPPAPKTPVEIKDPADVYQPSSDLEKLPPPEGLSDTEAKEIEDLIETVKTGSGMPAIRATTSLKNKGIQAVPLIANAMIGLDYTKPEANQSAFQLSEIVRSATHFPLGFQTILAGQELNLTLAHENAMSVKRLHQMASLYWHSEAGMKKFRAKYPETGDKNDDQ